MSTRRKRRRVRLGSHLAPMPRVTFGEHPGNEPRGGSKRRGPVTSVCGPPIGGAGKRTIQLCAKWSRPTKTVSGPTAACELLRDATHADRESFYAIHLDTRNRVIGVEEVAKGTLNGVEVHPREVFKSAMLTNARAMIIAHNHPSGDPTPSRQDIELTTRLVDVGKMLGVPILDHVILAADGCRSMAQQPAGMGIEFGRARRMLRRFALRRRR